MTLGSGRVTTASASRRAGVAISAAIVWTAVTRSPPDVWLVCIFSPQQPTAPLLTETLILGNVANAACFCPSDNAYRACTENEFQCNDHRCIRGELRCDTYINCPGREDEFGCGKLRRHFAANNTVYCCWYVYGLHVATHVATHVHVCRNHARCTCTCTCARMYKVSAPVCGARHKEGSVFTAKCLPWSIKKDEFMYKPFRRCEV